MPLPKTLFPAFMVFYGFLLVPAYGQVMSSAERKMMAALNTESNAIPKDLLMTKTIVVISMDNGENDIRGDWKALAEEAHFYIQRLGIDAVLYFYIDDLIAGYDIQRAISEQMEKREIKNILMLSKDKVNNRDQYIGVLTTWDEKPDMIANQQPSWKSQTSDLEILFRNLARSIDGANLTLENLLIIDSPEYFSGGGIVANKRMETFNTDLRIDRLAVPKFETIVVPENNTSASSEMAKIIIEENSKALARNGQLEQLMADYPYKYGIVSYDYDEKKLSAQGFQFVLMRVHSSGRNVRKVLGYEVSDEINELITMKKSSDGQIMLKSIPMDGMVYKYYVKHINSGEIFLGEQWDGDDNWQDAFHNHIAAIIAALKKN